MRYIYIAVLAQSHFKNINNGLGYKSRDRRQPTMIKIETLNQFLFRFTELILFVFNFIPFC